jgi:hypothetical protein
VAAGVLVDFALEPRFLSLLEPLIQLPLVVGVAAQPWEQEAQLVQIPYLALLHLTVVEAVVVLRHLQIITALVVVLAVGEAY